MSCIDGPAETLLLIELGVPPSAAKGGALPLSSPVAAGGLLCAHDALKRSKGSFFLLVSRENTKPGKGSSPKSLARFRPEEGLVFILAKLLISLVKDLVVWWPKTEAGRRLMRRKSRIGRST